MTDSRLQELKRAWEASRSVGDATAYLRERLRMGEPGLLAYYLDFEAGDQGGRVAHVPNDLAQTKCKDCGEPHDLIFQFSLPQIEGQQSQSTLTGVQCRDPGCEPTVQVQLDHPTVRFDERSSPVEFLPEVDPGKDEGLTDEQVDRCFEPKLLGLFVYDTAERIPNCDQCGVRMKLLLQLSSFPGNLNLGGRNLVLFYCPAHEGPVLHSTLL